MKIQRWIQYMFATGTIALLLAGCQSSTVSSEETEALRQQIAQLEQQISVLEQQANDRQDNALQETPMTTESNVQESTVAPESDDIQTPTDREQQAPNRASAQDSTQQSQNNSGAGKEQQSQDSTQTSTTNTMEELSSMVNAFVEKANAATPSGTATENMEQFFALKQEEKQIDNALDRHEDELEMLYKTQSLTREEYKGLERDLELLEDQLDAAEDHLEYVFGIDD